jgi:hypothetical protein
VGGNRKGYCARTKYEPTTQELAAFEKLQSMLTVPRFLVHFSPDRVLLLNSDALQERGFSVIAFHLTPGSVLADVVKKMSASRIQPILFMSKALSAAEKRYHVTELEVACLIWTCRKLRPMIQSSRSPVVVLTDHGATRGIYDRTSLNDFFWTIFAIGIRGADEL